MFTNQAVAETTDLAPMLLDTTDTPLFVVKRNGQTVVFDVRKIEIALTRCFHAINQNATPESISQIAHKAATMALKRFGATATVEGIQDAVLSSLSASNEPEALKAYRQYRSEHKRLRDERPIPEDVRYAFDTSAQYFPSPIQQFVYFNNYSRFDYSRGRRETWHETVERAVSYLAELSNNALGHEVYNRIEQAILAMRVVPSMRLLAMAGDAARRDNMAIYNCSYMGVDSLESFKEALLISMAGCGVGYSVERNFTDRLPKVKQPNGKHRGIYTIEDSATGWGDALSYGLETWFNGEDTEFDFSLLRPAGTPLRTKGGRASGPDPLAKMLSFIRKRIKAKSGSQLSSLDAHDIMCTIGQAAVSGGVRRTAMISLFDYDDEEMRGCKDGDFEKENSQRWNSNNSTIWPETVTFEQVHNQFTTMHDGMRGEPGIFSRHNANKLKPARRQEWEFGTNPCSEIVLRPFQFCNLSAGVARADDTFDTLKDKIEIATIIGTIQSLATYFPNLRPIWKENCENERLLGVDINGQMDSPVSRDPMVQRALAQRVEEVNQEVAAVFGIKPSAALTCVKPSGNSSQLLGCSSGLHTRWSEYYIRNVEVSVHSPLYKVLRDSGAPMSPKSGQKAENAESWVIHFPVKSPDGAITRHDRTAIQQCEYWLQLKQNWTEHNPSVSITYKPHELPALIQWVFDHQEYIGGMAFFPASDALYENPPYMEISKEEYERRAAEFPRVDFGKLYYHESTDLTNAAQELACSSGQCDL